MTTEEIHLLSYNIYSSGCRDGITSLALRQAIGDIYGNKTSDELLLCEKQAEKLMDWIDDLPGKTIYREDYLTVIDNYRHLLLPFFKLQLTMRQVIIGERYWKYVAARALAKKTDPDVMTVFSTARACMYKGQRSTITDSFESQLATIQSEYDASMHIVEGGDSRKRKDKVRGGDSRKGKDKARGGDSRKGKDKARDITKVNDTLELLDF